MCVIDIISVPQGQTCHYQGSTLAECARWIVLAAVGLFTRRRLLPSESQLAIRKHPARTEPHACLRELLHQLVQVPVATKMVSVKETYWKYYVVDAFPNILRPRPKIVQRSVCRKPSFLTSILFPPLDLLSVVFTIQSEEPRKTASLS